MGQADQEMQGGEDQALTRTPQYPVEIFEQFVKVQAEEIEFKKQELVLRQQQEQNNFIYAREALAAQTVDRKEERVVNNKIIRNVLITIVAIVFLICVLLGVAILMNKPDVAIKIVEYLVIFSAGGAGGYSVGKSRTVSNVAATGQEEDTD